MSQWVDFWRRLEGPELEPSIWHSHYLSYHVSMKPLSEMGRFLRCLVIDIGAGTGHGARYLDPSHTEYFPTDLPTGRDAADSGISKQAIAPVFQCSVYDLPFPEAHFGGAMMLSVLEHLEFPEKGLSEVYRVLKPDGYLLLSTPFAFPVHGAPWDFRRWTQAGLKADLEAVGFEIEKSANCGAGIAALTVNAHLLLRYHFLRDHYIGSKLIALLLPFIIFAQGIANVMALLLDPYDQSGAMPLAIAILAKKPSEP